MRNIAAIVASVVVCAAPALAEEKVEKCPFDGLSIPTKLISGGFGRVKGLVGNKDKISTLDPTTPPAPMQSVASAQRIYAPQAVAYLEKIRDKIIANAPDGAQNIKPPISVMGSTTYEAYALFDEGILFSHEILSAANTDDEVAFILAHELAHILYNDTKDGESLEKSMQRVELMRKGFDFASDVAAFTVADGSTAGEENATEIEKHNRKIDNYAETYRELSEKALRPIWQKSQEDEADLHAIYLMLNAGYSHTGALDAMDNMQKSYHKTCTELKALDESVDEYLTIFQSTDWAQMVTAQSVDWTIAFKPIAKKTNKRLRKALMSYVLPKTHRSWDSRKERFLKYITDDDQTELLDKAQEAVASSTGIGAYRSSAAYEAVKKSIEAARDVRVALTAGDINSAVARIDQVSMKSSHGRLLKRRVRLLQGRPTDAAKNVELALGLRGSSGQSPALRAYEIRAENLLSRGQFKNSSSVVASGEKQFTDKYHFLPERIFQLKTTGAAKEAEEMLIECETVDRRELWPICRAAEFGVRADFRDSAEEIIEQVQCPDNQCKKNQVGKFLKSTVDVVRN